MYALEKQEPQAQVAVILSRISSKSQEDGASVEGQLNNGREYCQRKGLKVIQVLILRCFLFFKSKSSKVL